MKNTSFLASAVTGVLLSTAVFAGGSASFPAVGTTTGHNSRTDTRGYIGLNWTWGGGYTPALVLGVTHTKVQSDGDTSGAKLAFHLNLLNGPAPGKLKLSYLNGKEDVQGEIGVGYDFIKSAPLLGLGVNVPYLSAGADVFMNPGVVPFATLNSQGKFDKPRGKTTTYSCPPQYVLVGTTCMPEET